MTQLTFFILNFYIGHCKLPQTVFTAKLKLKIQKEKLSFLPEKDIFLAISSSSFSSSSSSQFKSAKRAKFGPNHFPVISSHQGSQRN